MGRPSGNSRRLGAALLAAVALVALGQPAAAGAHEFPTRSFAQPRADVLAYWTDERIAAARPASELLAGVAAPTGAASGERGEPYSVASAAPASHAGALGDLLRGETATRGAAQQIASPASAPFRTHGKAYFALGGLQYVCSGTVVNARNRRLVSTAGHCVFGFGQFATNWMFVPGKDGSSEPYGRWVARRVATTPQWEASEDIRYDVGMAVMRRRNDERLQNVVGARGIAFNKGRNLTFDAFGYPAEPPFGGAQLYRCTSPAEGTDGSVPAPRTTRIDCDMTGGASGGGWVIGRGRVNSVTSYGYECPVNDILCEIFGGNPEDGKLFGPYFGNTIEDLYRTQQRRLGAHR